VAAHAATSQQFEAELHSLREQCASHVVERAAVEEKTLQLLREKDRHAKRSLEEAMTEREKLYSEALDSVHSSYQRTIRELEARAVQAEASNAQALAELDDQAKQERHLKFEALRAESAHSVVLAEARMRDEYNATLSRLISSHRMECDRLERELEDTRDTLRCACAAVGAAAGE
jgi:chromosome segregation ATPase